MDVATRYERYREYLYDLNYSSFRHEPSFCASCGKELEEEYSDMHATFEDKTFCDEDCLEKYKEDYIYDYEE